MRSEDGRPGRIVPPLLTLNYGLLPAGQAAASVTVRLRVTYSMDMADAREQIEVGRCAASAALLSAVTAGSHLLLTHSVPPPLCRGFPVV